MPSRSLRLLVAALAFIVIGGAAAYLVQLESQAARRRDAHEVFEDLTGRVSRAVAAVHAAQLAYVAEGQGPGVWRARVAESTAAAEPALDRMSDLAATAAARTALLEARAYLGELGALDRRALEYLADGQTVMASDLVFAEGGPAAALILELVDAARSHEADALHTFEAGNRRTRRYAAGGTAAAVGLAILLLAFAGPPGLRGGAVVVEAQETLAVPGVLDLDLRGTTPTPAEPPASRLAALEPPDPTLPLLRTAAEICWAFNRAGDADQLEHLLGEAAVMMGATGVIVWMGDADGADLRPVLARGYSAAALSRLPAIPRSADNAAAAAYRTGLLQIVPGRGEGGPGAMVAPLPGPGGCIGSLTVEVPAGRESAGTPQALALLFAAQLSSLVPGAAVPTAIVQPDVRSASA